MLGLQMCTITLSFILWVWENELKSSSACATGTYQLNYLSNPYVIFSWWFLYTTKWFSSLAPSTSHMVVIMDLQIHLCSHWLSYCFREEGWNAPGLSGRPFSSLFGYTVVWVLNGGLPSVIVLTSNYTAVTSLSVCAMEPRWSFQNVTPKLVPSHIQIKIQTASLVWLIQASFFDFLFTEFLHSSVYQPPYSLLTLPLRASA